MNRPHSFDKHYADEQRPLHEASSLYFARLMRPDEVASATRNHPGQVRARLAGHWMLCGDVSKEMFQQLKQAPSQDFPARLSAFSSSNGCGYGVLTHQIAGHQHRFLFCLSDPPVRQFLQSVSKDRVGFMLGNDDADDAMVLESFLGSTAFIPLLAMSFEENKDEQRKALLELPAVLEAMTHPLQVPSLFGGESVRQVGVSLLLPRILDEEVKTTLRHAGGK